MREPFKWCKSCECFHSPYSQHTGKIERKYPTFEEYVALCVNQQSDEAQRDCTVNPQGFYVLKAVWHITWLQGKGEHEVAEEERKGLKTILQEEGVLA